MKILLPSAKPSQTKCLEPFKPHELREGCSLSLTCKHLELSGDDSDSRAHPPARSSREVQHKYNTRGFQSCNISSKPCKEQILLEHFHHLHDGNYIRCCLYWNLREHFRKCWHDFTFPFIPNHCSTLNLPHLYSNHILTWTFSSPCLAQSYK